MVAGHFVMIPLWAPPVQLVAHAMRLRGYGGAIKDETELVRLVQRVGALGARSSTLLDPTARSQAEIVATREREAAAAVAVRARQAEEAAARSAVGLAEAQAHCDATEKERADAEAALTCAHVRLAEAMTNKARAIVALVQAEEEAARAEEEAAGRRAAAAREIAETRLARQLEEARAAARKQADEHQLELIRVLPHALHQVAPTLASLGIGRKQLLLLTDDHIGKLVDNPADAARLSMWVSSQRPAPDR